MIVINNPLWFRVPNDQLRNNHWPVINFSFAITRLRARLCFQKNILVFLCSLLIRAFQPTNRYIKNQGKICWRESFAVSFFFLLIPIHEPEKSNCIRGNFSIETRTSAEGGQNRAAKGWREIFTNRSPILFQARVTNTCLCGLICSDKYSTDSLSIRMPLNHLSVKTSKKHAWAILANVNSQD